MKKCLSYIIKLEIIINKDSNYLLATFPKIESNRFKLKKKITLN